LPLAVFLVPGPARVCRRPGAKSSVTRDCATMYRRMRFPFLTALLLVGCPGNEHFHPQLDASVPPPEGIAIHGRVVDFESCPVPPGCRPVPGLVVRVDGTALASAPTGSEGAFLIEDVPKDIELSFTVGSATGGGFATTRAAPSSPA